MILVRLVFFIFWFLLFDQSCVFAREVGALPFNSIQTLTIGQDELQGFRFAGFEGMEILVRAYSLKLEEEADFNNLPPIFIEGPLTDLGKVEVGHDTRRDQEKPRFADERRFILPRKGAYRIVFGTLPFPKDVVFQVKCLKNCNDPKKSITIQDYLKEVSEYRRKDSVLSALKAQLSHFPLLLNRLEEWLLTQDLTKLRAMSTVSIQELAALKREIQSLSVPLHSVRPEEAIQGELEDLLEVEHSVAYPKAGRGSIVYGHFPDFDLSGRQVNQSINLAKILTSLSLGNASEVNYNGQSRYSPAQLVDGLINSGHSIELYRMKAYANFLSFQIDGDRDLVWPVWIDTGFYVDGFKFVVPAGHTEYIWKITGPLVNTSVSYFHGTGGLRFYEKTTVRPAWTHPISELIATSAQNQNNILIALSHASVGISKNRAERDLVSTGAFGDGYFVLGTCNESTARLDRALGKRELYGYPFLRDSNFSPEDGEFPDDLSPKLPPDEHKRDVFKRILAMNPVPFNSEEWLSRVLRNQMAQIKKYTELMIPREK